LDKVSRAALTQGLDEPTERFDQTYHRWWVRRTHPDKVAEYTLRSHWVWYHVHGEWPPAGMVVHHVNENREDDNPDNLELLTRAEHCRLHRPGDTVPYEDRRRMMLEARVTWQRMYGR
jgi:hypothetical protein